MKEKTSITLSKDVLTGIDRAAGTDRSRSAFIERVLRQYFRQQARVSAMESDLKGLNAAADRLNSEAADVLQYQAGDE